MDRATHDFPRNAPAAPATLRPVTFSDDRADNSTTVVRRRASRGAYVRRVLVGDAGCALVAVAAALATTAPPPTIAEPAWWLAGGGLSAVWVSALFLARGYDPDVLGEGPVEFGRVFVTAAWVLGGMALVSWGGRLDTPPAFLAVVLPLATALTLAHRQAQRRWLRRGREKGRFLRTLLLVGNRNAVYDLNERLRGRPELGYRAIGCCLPTATAGGTFGGLPVLGNLECVADVVRRHDVDAVAVLHVPELAGAALRRLGWDLEETDAELLASSCSEMAEPRVRTRPVWDLSLLRMERPEMRGPRGLIKSVFDRVGAALLLVLLAPLLVTIAVTVKVTGRGPMFLRQQRVGRDGRIFTMLTFRVPEERSTRAGRALRRYSLDELPQLVNVLKGDMSLVGPRPSAHEQVERPGDGYRRRLVAQPGLTGLWQLSGRFDLSWEESVRRDLRYVENWSLLLDLTILWRTVAAAVRPDRA